MQINFEIASWNKSYVFQTVSIKHVRYIFGQLTDRIDTLAEKILLEPFVWNRRRGEEKKKKKSNEDENNIKITYHGIEECFREAKF
jgi:hypothetical protein